MIRSGARRLLAFTASLAAGSAAVAALLGLATGNGVARPIGLAYYAIGSVTAVIGFALGSQGLFRPPPRRNAPERRSAEEVRESRVIAALLMLVGVLLVVLGIAVDPNARLV